MPRHTPGDLGQDLLDADDEFLVLGRVTLNGSVQPGHVEVQSAECGRLPRAWEWQGASQPSPLRSRLGGWGSTGAQVRGSGFVKGGSWGRGPWNMSGVR